MASGCSGTSAKVKDALSQPFMYLSRVEVPGLDSASATYYVGKPPASMRLICKVASEERLAHGAAGRVQRINVITVKCTKQGLLC